MTTTSGTSAKSVEDMIRFEIRDGMRRVSFVGPNEALEAASGLPSLSSANAAPADRSTASVP